MSSPAQGKQEADRILVVRQERLAGRSPYPTQGSRGSCAEHLQSVGAGGCSAVRFRDGLPRSPGPASGDTALRNYGVPHSRGVFPSVHGTYQCQSVHKYN